MSPALIATAAIIAFVLAIYSIREAIGLKPAERVGRWALLATAAGGGAMFVTVLTTLIGAVTAQDSAVSLALKSFAMRDLITLGVVLGLAAVVLGPTLKDAVFLVIRRKAGSQPPSEPKEPKP